MYDDERNYYENNTSGQGRDSEVPDIVAKKFNWGAFFFTWIWGIFYKQWLSLLVIPVWIVLLMFNTKDVSVSSAFTLCVGLYMGSHGNKWAWQAKHYNSVNEFHSIQRRWVIGFFLGIIVIPAVLAFALAFISSSNLGSKELRGNDVPTTQNIQKARSCYRMSNGKCIKGIRPSGYMDCSRTGNNLNVPENRPYCGKQSQDKRDLWAGTKKSCANIGMRLASMNELAYICRTAKPEEMKALTKISHTWTSTEINANSAYYVKFRNKCELDTGSRDSHYVSTYALCVKD